MKWTPNFNTDTCNKWLIYLEENNLINISENIGHLVPPFSISIGNNIYKDIVNIYVPKEEKGGIMFASILKEENYLTLEIESIIEIQNDVEIVFPGYSKSNSYFPNSKKYIETLSNNFTESDPSKIYLPIHFHTHPTRDKSEDVTYFHQLWHPLNMSQADIEVSKSRHIQLRNLSLFYLNAIITGDENEHRIIFYGNNVTPENYGGEKSAQFFTAINDITDGIESEGWRTFTRIGLVALGAIGGYYQPQITLSLLDDFVYALDKKEYWGKLEKKATTIIKIPLRELKKVDKQ